ncbi:hypothetical protein CBR_g31517 [Chara braunii]|uniref:Pentacotripeptide-repeat region of PRORP domain-containing protein n=1 Tax=Chara braunii TaxID=69332 RepID=A0A388LF65_CHABU|nr:hypothetical protein CBR_g31517 [Chara braunii]|eukprot:GBG80960.1 hypothetical protein CBR_g31517 [Chara braunii]
MTVHCIGGKKVGGSEEQEEEEEKVEEGEEEEEEENEEEEAEEEEEAAAAEEEEAAAEEEEEEDYIYMSRGGGSIRIRRRKRSEEGEEIGYLGGRRGEFSNDISYPLAPISRLLQRGIPVLERCRRAVSGRLTRLPRRTPSNDEIYRAREGFARALEQLDSRRPPGTHGAYAATELELDLDLDLDMQSEPCRWDGTTTTAELLDRQLSDLREWQAGNAQECFASDGESLGVPHLGVDDVQWLSREDVDADADVAWEVDARTNDASSISKDDSRWSVDESSGRLTEQQCVPSTSMETVIDFALSEHGGTWDRVYPPDAFTTDLTVVPNPPIVCPPVSTSSPRGPNGQPKPPWRRTIGGLQYGVGLAGLMAPRTAVGGAEDGVHKPRKVQKNPVNASTKLWRRRGLGSNHVLGAQSWSKKRLKLARRRSERSEESEMGDVLLTGDTVTAGVAVLSSALMSKQHSVGTYASSYLHSRMDGVMRILSEQTDANLASHVFEWAKQQEWYVPDGRTYAELIRIMVWGGHMDLAEELVKEMEMLGYVDEDTLMVMLGAYIREGAHDKTGGVCKQMLDAGFITQNMYGTMVSLVADLEVMKRWRHVIEELFAGSSMLNRGAHIKDDGVA